MYVYLLVVMSACKIDNDGSCKRLHYFCTTIRLGPAFPLKSSCISTSYSGKISSASTLAVGIQKVYGEKRCKQDQAVEEKLRLMQVV